MTDAQRWAAARDHARTATFGTFGVAAVHFFQGVPPGRPCRVILRRPDEVVDWGGGGRALVDAVTLDVRVAEVPDLERGDRFVVGDVEYVVTAEPRRDADRLIWTAEARVR